MNIHVYMYTYILITAIVEYVRDGSTLRAMVIPDYIQLTVAMSGIKVCIYLANSPVKQITV